MARNTTPAPASKEVIADAVAIGQTMDAANQLAVMTMEANEAALKIARKYGHQKGIDRAEVVVFENAFHGRTIATLTATDNPAKQQGFEPLLPRQPSAAPASRPA